MPISYLYANLDMTMQEDKRLFLLDAYALIFRAYYAFIKNPRINSKGENTSAILGFTNTLLDLIKRENPTHLAVCFDVGRETFRHQDYPKYKANRDETPEGIKTAVPYICDILKALKIPIFGMEGYEADDLIGTLSKKAEKEGYTTYMMTSDKDFAQLVSENIFMYRPARQGNIEIWGVPEVKEKFGVEHPLQVIDFLGMMGDSVDNIPGLPGVGEKTAKKFIAEYGSMENLLEHTDDLSGKMKENIENNKAIGLLSKKLATIHTDAPIEFEEDKFIIEKPDFEEIQNIFNELEFRRSLENLYRTYNISPNGQSIESPKNSSNTKENGVVQLGLFDSFNEETLPDAGANFKTAENTSHFYQLIDSRLAQKKLLENLLQQSVVCFDTETTSLNALEAQLVGISFSYEAHKGYYLPFPEDFKEAQYLVDVFRPFFENENITKIAHNFKYDYKVLNSYNLQVKGPMFDTMIAHYLLNPDARHSMDVLAETILNYKPISIESLIGKKGKNQKNFRSVDLKEQTEYAVEDADITFQLYEVLLPEIEKEEKLKALFYEVEIPLMRVLAEMEIAGITIDTPFLHSYSKELEVQMNDLEKKIYEEAGEQFNLNSPKQLGEILFGKLQLDSKAKKTKTGQYKTSEDVLRKLAPKNPIIEDILNYRQLQKLKSTYVDALPSEANAITHRVHTTFSQTVAATGRLASSNPNLQNIPIKTERGREVRKAFVPRNKDFVLLAADYSQIELRLIAEFSGDKEMVKAFQNNEDIHASTAAKLFDTDIDKVSRAQRSQAKTVNFGIVYGVSAFGLSEQANVSRKEAKELIDTYYATYPSLKNWMDEQIQKARENGYVETILGRKRYLRGINSANAIVRGQAERNAINAPVQGSAADIIKLAMIDIQRELRVNDYQSDMLLQVHDELVFEVHKDHVERVRNLVQYKMEHAYATKVPLEVEVGIGDNWLEAH